MDAVDRAGITAFYASTSSEPARQLILVVRRPERPARRSAMSASSQAPLPEPPNPKELEHRDVLLHYGATMEAVQGFEHTLKSILLFHRAFVETAAGPIRDEEFERLFDETQKSPLGPVLKSLQVTLRALKLAPFPAAMETGLASIVKLRNRLAHSYLVERSRVLLNPDARRGLIAELTWYAQIFFTMDTRMQRWLDSLLKHLGHTRAEIEEQFGSAMEEVQLEALNAELHRMELDV